MAKRTDRAHFSSFLILSFVPYENEAWALTKKEKKPLAGTQQSMERRMLELTLSDHASNNELRRMVKTLDLKWKGASSGWLDMPSYNITADGRDRQGAARKE